MTNAEWIEVGREYCRRHGLTYDSSDHCAVSYYDANGRHDHVLWADVLDELNTIDPPDEPFGV